MKVLSIVGARPEFVQSAPLTRELRREHHEVLVHTGQHYDYLMSKVFFQDLGIPDPDYDLGVGSGSHGQQTGEMLTRLESVILKERPDWVIIRGDTNSTLAGALAAAKLNVRVAHVEAGARSFNRTMPEEINRIVADQVANLCFCISPSAVQNLRSEGITRGVHYVGDVMYDALLDALPVAIEKSRILQDLQLEPKSYVLATIHRASNTDNADALRAIVGALSGANETIVFPIHPRTRKAIDALDLDLGPKVKSIDPIGYLDMLSLERSARAVVTDSGGVTREAYLLGVPCITVREETEHVETVTAGWNMLVGSDPGRIHSALREFCPVGPRPAVFGDGTAARKIVQILASA